MYSSSNFLVDHALKNVWCSPGADRQHIIRPARISKRRGEIGTVKIGMDVCTLPTSRDTYHVFSIGDVIPLNLGMQPYTGFWVSAKAHCNSNALIIDLYNEYGVRYPIALMYFLYTKHSGLYVAIRHDRSLTNYGVENPYIRWRSNLYFDISKPTVAHGGRVEIGYCQPSSVNELNAFQAEWRNVRDREGYTMVFKNGYRIRDINQVTCSVGDHIEYVRDESIDEVIEYQLEGIPSFTSELDNRVKYLLLRHGLGEHIDYEDDVDIHILRYTKPAAYDGIYYHRNRSDSIRMVTHRDYSVNADYVDWLVREQTHWLGSTDIRLELIVRKSGLERPLPDEDNRIKELFKLDNVARQAAMFGENSAVPFWRASELEKSNYVKLMSLKANEITQHMVEDAYGYNAISKLVGDMPQRIDNGKRWVQLPNNAIKKSTVFEYDRDGVLIGWYSHENALEYPIRNPETYYIEAFPGESGVGVCTVYDSTDYKIEAGLEYRFYICSVVDGVVMNDWSDVTGDDRYYYITSDGYVRWNISKEHYKTAIRNDRDFLCYNLELDYRDGLMVFTVQSQSIQIGRGAILGPYLIPPGQVDIFLNGHELVPGIDVQINWPEICIVNAEHLNHEGLQKITIRGRGFCTKDMKLEEVADTGFVKHGKLSQNGRFNIRDDKVTRVCVGGHLYMTDEVKFAEDSDQLEDPTLNGQPYKISHPYVPLLGITYTPTSEMRDRAQERDKIVADYMSVYKPEVPSTEPVPIQRPWKLYSPFTTKLIYDMLNGILLIDDFKSEYSLEYVYERLKGYSWLVPYDPVIVGTDPEYVVVLPHPDPEPITLTIYQYRLLYRAIQVFLDGKVHLYRDDVIIENGYEHEQEGHTHPDIRYGLT